MGGCSQDHITALDTGQLASMCFTTNCQRANFQPRVKSLLCESVRFVEVLVYCYISTALMRKTSKQTECGHAIGCELVKHKVSLTVDRAPLCVVIYVHCDAMQKIAQKSLLFQSHFARTMAQTTTLR